MSAAAGILIALMRNVNDWPGPSCKFCAWEEEWCMPGAACLECLVWHTIRRLWKLLIFSRAVIYTSNRLAVCLQLQ